MNDADGPLSAAQRTALERIERNLVPEIAPGRDLWPGIAARLRHPRSGDRGWQPFAAAVSVAAVAALAAVLMIPRAPALPDTGLAQLPDVYALPAAVPTGHKYLIAQKDLTGHLADQLDRLPPAGRRAVLANLREIRRTIEQIDAALKENPDNVLLQEMLMSVYQKELDLLISVQRLADESPAERIDL